MPLFKNLIAEELENKKDKFSIELSPEIVKEYRKSVSEVFSNFSKKEIEEEIEDVRYPGAIPTDEFDEAEKFGITFERSLNWQSHEAVNNWAKDQLKGLVTIGADGSQIDPVKEFEKPIGLVQVVWIANKHSINGDYEENAKTVVLTPDDLFFENPNSGYIQVDDQEVPLTRFETEMEVLRDQIEEYSEEKPAPVVFYDGSLILSFIQMFDQKAQKRYSDALARLLAASQYHRVPVVGYVSGSKATELGGMIKNLDILDTDKKVRDYQLLRGILENWGSRTPLFYAHRDKTQKRLKTTYKDIEFDFSDKILLSYLKTGSGEQIDRIELPEWIYKEGKIDDVMSVVRAETAVGRGYPEILQAVDTDAVLSNRDREEFMRICQEFSEEKDIDLSWNNKALSKKRRRR